MLEGTSKPGTRRRGLCLAFDEDIYGDGYIHDQNLAYSLTVQPRRRRKAKTDRGAVSTEKKR